MTFRMFFSVSLLCAIFLPGICTYAAEMQDERLALSKTATGQFMKTLKGELTTALKAGGPANAIHVCQRRAPQIAAEVSAGLSSASTRVKISRTSLKPRNPTNAPAAWQREVLEAFEQRRKDGETAETIDWFNAGADGSARYMKAIGTQPMCLICHGRTLSPAIADTLRQLYPQDRATGFDIGDLRGAFSVEWSAVTDTETGTLSAQ